MNPYTGHLLAMPREMSESEHKGIMGELERQGYEPVPPELERAAQRKLAGRSEAMVSLTSGGKLSRWAAGRRNERKVRNRTAKESKKKNRGR